MKKKILTCDNPLYLRHCSSSWRGGCWWLGGVPWCLILFLGDYELSVFVKMSNTGHPSLVLNIWLPISVEFLIEDILGLLKKMHGSGKGLFSDCCISYVVLVQGYEQHSSNSIVESKWFTFDWLCLSAESFVGLILVYLRKAPHESSKISVEHVQHVARI